MSYRWRHCSSRAHSSLGEGPLKDLALALFVGMVSGAYSSIFIATPLLAQMKEREPDMKKLAARVQARRAKESQKERVAATAATTRDPATCRRSTSQAGSEIAHTDEIKTPSRATPNSKMPKRR